MLYTKSDQMRLATVTTATMSTTDFPQGKQKQRQRRRVAFGPLPTPTSSRQTNMTVEELPELWYSPEEMMEFRKNAKQEELKLELQEQQQSSIGSTPTLHHKSTREGRFLYKRLAIHTTVQAYKQGKPAHLISQRCSRPHVVAACLRACHDYYDVYQPQKKHEVPAMESLPEPEFPFSFSMKRKNRESKNDINNEQHERRVRRRFVATATTTITPSTAAAC